MTTTPITQTEAVKIKSAREAIALLMSDNRHWSSKRLGETMFQRFGISCSESAITARIRDMRKPEFGGKRVDCTVSNGGMSGRKPFRIYRIVPEGEA